MQDTNGSPTGGAAHTSDLDHALADALHEAEAVRFDVVERGAITGRPTWCLVTVTSRNAQQFEGDAETAAGALKAALTGLRAATGGAQ
jgi:tRNA pseudouridine-54 N-methylase